MVISISECSEVPTLSPMSSRSNLSIASSRSAMSARSTRSDTGHRSTHHLSIMQTLAEAEDSDQGNAQNTGFAAETEEGSLAVTAGSVAIDQGSWQRDLENWARHSSPPLDEIADPTDVDESQLSPASSLHRRRTNKDRHLSSSSTIATASSTISYLVRFNATSPRLHSNSESGSSDSQPQRLSLHIPHDSQRGTSRKPPSSKRTRQQHIVAGLQGDEWSGHRSLTAELQAATSMQQKAASEAFSSQKEQNEYSGTKATSPLAEQSTADTDSPARSMSPARTRSPLTASSTLRIAAEALSESVTSVAQAVGLIGESSDTKADAGEMQNHDITRSLSEQSRRPDESQVPLAPILQVEVSSPDRAIRSVDSEAPETYDSRACAKPQRQDTNLKSPSRKKAKRTRLTEAQTEQQRLKEAARHIKEQQKAARWHQRHLAIDAKKAFQTKKDELHTRLANTRNEDARSEVQWELGELYAAYAWGETSETPTGRDKPALGAGALTHALRVMYEALYAPSRRDKSTISSVALDPDKWGRYAHLHMIMWGQTRGKTHLEWALRAYNEAIKLSGDKTELTGDICTTAAQFLQSKPSSVSVSAKC